jgi:hypothetical protein
MALKLAGGLLAASSFGLIDAKGSAFEAAPKFVRL